MDVLSGIPQGSVLGPALFICFINDMPDVVESCIRMFADDTKIYAPVNNKREQERLQQDLQALQKWSQDWQLRFNATKCKVMHLGYGNLKHECIMEGDNTRTVLETSDLEKDLGVHMDPTLNFSKHCERAANKANRIVGLIRRSFSYMDSSMLTQLYKGLVRPHLEYGNTVWSPLFKKDAIILENVQHRATKLVPDLKDLPYEERLQNLKLPSLMYRRLRGDLIETFKYLQGYYKVDTKKLLPLSEEKRTRGHEFKLEKLRSRLDIRKNFYNLRVHDEWNSLPERVVQAPSVNSFKGRIDRHLQGCQYNTDFPLRPVHRKETPLASDKETQQEV